MPADPSTNTPSHPRYFVLCVGLTFLLFSLWSLHGAYLLKNQGMPIQGTVSKCSLVRHKGSITYNVEYSYAVAGQSYFGAADVAQATFLTLRPGSPIPLRYVPSNPSISETWGISHSGTTIFLAGYLGIPVSFFILFQAFKKEEKVPEKFLRDAALRRAPMPVEAEEEIPGHIELPNTVKGIAYTVYPVTDMARARKFYEDDLGLRVAKHFRGEWVEYHIWDNCFAITSMAGTGLKPSSDLGGKIAFEVNDVDKMVETLRKKGTPIKLEPFSTPVCRMAVILDPEGNALTLHKKTTT